MSKANEEAVKTWLTEKGWAQYISTFQEAGINSLAELKEVTSFTLRRLGILESHKIKLWNHILTLAKEPEQVATPREVAPPQEPRAVIQQQPQSEPKPQQGQLEPFKMFEPAVIVGQETKDECMPDAKPEWITTDDVMVIDISRIDKKNQVLGRGSFKEVTLCQLNGKSFALVTSAQEEADLKRELSLLLNLCHPSVVPVLAVVTRKNKLEGWLTEIFTTDLQKKLADDQEEVQTWSLEQRSSLLSDVASALAYLHTAFGRPLVHRDVKPANVFLARNSLGVGAGLASARVTWLAKLGDFGLTCEQTQDSGIGKTILGKDVRAGTVQYQAPEFFNADPKITHKVDIFAFALLAVAVSSGQEPWTEFKMERQIWAQQSKNGHFRPPQMDSLSQDGPLFDLLSTCLVEHVENRPSALQCFRFFHARLYPQTSSQDQVQQPHQDVPAKTQNDDDEAVRQAREERNLCMNAAFLTSFVALLADLRKQAPHQEKQQVLRLFISYAWYPEDDPRNPVLQKILKQLKQHLKTNAFVADVFLDCTGDMNGNIPKTMQQALERATYAIVIGTSRSKVRIAAKAVPINNLQFEYQIIGQKSLAYRQMKQPLPFAFCLPVEPVKGVNGNWLVADYFPTCLATAYPHSEEDHERSREAHTCVPVCVDPEHLDLEGDYFRTVASLVETLAAVGSPAACIKVARDLFDAQFCGQNHSNLDESKASDAEQALRSFVDDLNAQKLMTTAIRRRCYIDSPRKVDVSARQKLEQLVAFIQSLGVEVVTNLFEFGTKPLETLDRYLVVGFEGHLHGAETDRVCRDVYHQILVPIVLSGTISALDHLRLKDTLILNLAKYPYEPASVRDLVCRLFAWDLDDHIWLNAALQLYEERRGHDLCALCKDKASLKAGHSLNLRPVTEFKPKAEPKSTPEPKAVPVVADVVSDVPMAQGNSDGEKTAWLALQEIIPDLKSMELADFFCLTSPDLTEFIASQQGLSLSAKAKLRRLHLRQC